MENENYGKVTVGFGSPEQHELEIKDFIQADFKDHRLISMAKLEDESFLLSVENPPSSGRATQQAIRLSLESTIGLVSTVMLYFNKKGLDMDSLIQQAVETYEINFSISQNISQNKKDS
ncbi:hypothetical protein [Chryseobacterium mucoviscidosis]|uniref:hypothetical protein n=1 Tax=Chryseobacterium mucoviscidosis TaxID=1945581 RepID=UPI003018A42B